MNNINKSELLSKVLTNVLFIAIFITIFFFTYGSYLEKEIVKDQMTFLSRNLKQLFKLFGNDANDILISNIKQIKLPDLTEENKKVKENNNKVKITALIFILSITVLLSSILALLFYRFNGKERYELNKIFSENLVILIFVVAVYFVFFTFFSARYVSIDPNIVKLTILELFKEKEII